MANIAKMKLPNNSTYDLKDANAGYSLDVNNYKVSLKNAAGTVISQQDLPRDGREIETDIDGVLTLYDAFSNPLDTTSIAREINATFDRPSMSVIINNSACNVRFPRRVVQKSAMGKVVSADYSDTIFLAASGVTGITFMENSGRYISTNCFTELFKQQLVCANKAKMISATIYYPTTGTIYYAIGLDTTIPATMGMFKRIGSNPSGAADVIVQVVVNEPEKVTHNGVEPNIYLQRPNSGIGYVLYDTVEPNIDTQTTQQTFYISSTGNTDTFSISNFEIYNPTTESWVVTSLPTPTAGRSTNYGGCYKIGYDVTGSAFAQNDRRAYRLTVSGTSNTTTTYYGFATQQFWS